MVETPSAWESVNMVTGRRSGRERCPQEATIALRSTEGACVDSAPELVMFDLNYTLLRPGEQFGPVGYERVGRRFGLDLDLTRWAEAERSVHAVATARRAERGGAHDDGMLALVARTFIEGLGGGPEDAAAAAKAMVASWSQAEHFDLYDDVLPCLERLREVGIRMVVVSNNIGKGVGGVVGHFGLDAYLEFVVSSADVGYLKPAPEVFAAVLTRTGLLPGQVVMVGDSIENDVKGALACGCEAILLDRANRAPHTALRRIETLAELPTALGL